MIITIKTLDQYNDDQATQILDHLITLCEDAWALQILVGAWYHLCRHELD